MKARNIVQKIKDDFREDLLTTGIIQATDMAIAWIDRVRGELEIYEAREHTDGTSYFKEISVDMGPNNCVNLERPVGIRTREGTPKKGGHHDKKGTRKNTHELRLGIGRRRPPSGG